MTAERRLVIALLACLAVAGAVLLFAGLSGTPTQRSVAPLPERQFSAAPAAVSKGATGEARAASAPVLAPDSLSIPSLGTSAALVTEPLLNGSLSIPPDVKHVGIWSGGAKTYSTTGTVLLAGHINWYNQGNGALYNLSTVKPGAAVYVSGPTGTTTSWTITSLRVYPQTGLPVSQIFAPTGPRRLVIVTCGGPFNYTTHLYADNVVATAIPA